MKIGVSDFMFFINGVISSFFFCSFFIYLFIFIYSFHSPIWTFFFYFLFPVFSSYLFSCVFYLTVDLFIYVPVFTSFSLILFNIY